MSSPVNICLSAISNAVPASWCIRAPAAAAHATDAIPIDSTRASYAALPGAVVAAI
jgi:hypothetical protein